MSAFADRLRRRVVIGRTPIDWWARWISGRGRRDSLEGASFDRLSAGLAVLPDQIADALDAGFERLLEYDGMCDYFGPNEHQRMRHLFREAFLERLQNGGPG